MIVYHRTSTEAAKAVCKSGFRDGEGRYMTRHTWRGVWVSDQDLDSEAPNTPALITIDLPDATFEEYEWVEEGKGYREALVPARILNQCRLTF